MATWKKQHFAWKAISLAGHLKPKGLIVLWDHNNITIDGLTSLSTSTDELKRFEAAGWITDARDGHDAADVFRAPWSNGARRARARC